MVKPIRLMGQFPPLPAGRAVRQIIADGLIGQWRLLMGAALIPFILALLTDFVATLYLDVRDIRNIVASPEAIAVNFANVLIIELFIGALYTTNVARLLGIGWRKGRMQMTDEWREAYGSVILRLLIFYIPGGLLIIGGFVAYLFFKDSLPSAQLAPLLIAVPAIIQLYLYARFSFVVAAAAVGAPYTFGDSIRATGGITLLILGLNIVFCLPLIVAQLGLQVSASTAPVFGLSYFGFLLATQALFLFRVAVFTVINLVCFVNRTGWAPGARRI